MSTEICAIISTKKRKEAAKVGEIRYKIDVIGALKEAGFNSGHIRKNHLLAEGTMQSLRERKPVTFTNLAKLCRLLDCQPGDILEYVPDDPAQD